MPCIAESQLCLCTELDSSVTPAQVAGCLLNRVKRLVLVSMHIVFCLFVLRKEMCHDGMYRVFGVWNSQSDSANMLLMSSDTLHIRKTILVAVSLLCLLKCVLFLFLFDNAFFAFRETTIATLKRQDFPCAYPAHHELKSLHTGTLKKCLQNGVATQTMKTRRQPLGRTQASKTRMTTSWRMGTAGLISGMQ